MQFSELKDSHCVVMGWVVSLPNDKIIFESSREYPQYRMDNREKEKLNCCKTILPLMLRLTILPLMLRFKTRHTCHLMVSVGWESGHGLEVTLQSRGCQG